MGLANAIVVGGGIGGLAAATALAQRGVAVTLLEQAPELREVGAGLQVSPNGLCVLRALGVAQDLPRVAAVRGQAVVLRDFARGDQVARLDLTRLPQDQAYHFVHRADLVDLLARAALRANVTIELGIRVADLRVGNPPEVTLSDGQKLRAELIVAADGVHSKARAVLNGPDAPQFSGQVAWRAVVPNTGAHPDEVHVAMGPGRHLVSYPLRDGQMVNLVAVEERQAWAPDGWSHSDDPEHLRTAFEAFGGRVAGLLAEVADVNLWGLNLYPVAQRWGMGGVALLGDAAHPTLPFLAQGANLALEDAYVLAASVCDTGNDGLGAYEALRRPRASRVVHAASRNAWRYHLRPGPVRTAAHLVLRMASQWMPGRMLGAYDWLYGHDVTR